MVLDRCKVRERINRQRRPQKMDGGKGARRPFPKFLVQLLIAKTGFPSAPLISPQWAWISLTTLSGIGM